MWNIEVTTLLAYKDDARYFNEVLNEEDYNTIKKRIYVRTV